MTATGYVNLGYLNATKYTAVDGAGTATIDSFSIAVDQSYTTVTPQSGTVGTVSQILLSAAAGTGLQGHLPRILLRTGIGTFIEFVQATPGTVNGIQFNSGVSFHLTGSKTLELQRTQEGWWSSTEGIQLAGGAVVTTTAQQTLSNKLLTSPVISSTLAFDGQPFGNSAIYYGQQVGTRTHNATPVTVASLAVPEIRVSTIHGYASGVDDTGTVAVGVEFYGVFRRETAASLTLIGTKTPTVIHNTGGSPTVGLAANVGNNTAEIQLTGAGTLSWIVNFFHFTHGVSAI